jgi:Magnesium chelatase, subunit ChlI
MRLARRLTSILPTMTLAEALEPTRLHRVAGLTGARTALVTTRPCRAPHHTISDAGLIGGGHVPLPGEVSLAHHGVLCLDERPECRRPVLEVLRQPLEEGVTSIPSPARPRPHRARHPSRARGACADRPRRIRGWCRECLFLGRFGDDASLRSRVRREGRQQPDQDLGMVSCDTRDQWRVEHRSVRRLEPRGYRVPFPSNAL